MLRILDKNNKTKFILSDEAEEPVSIDDLVVKEATKEQQPAKPEPKE